MNGHGGISIWTWLKDTGRFTEWSRMVIGSFLKAVSFATRACTARWLVRMDVLRRRAGGMGRHGIGGALGARAAVRELSVWDRGRCGRCQRASFDGLMGVRRTTRPAKCGRGAGSVGAPVIRGAPGDHVDGRRTSHPAQLRRPRRRRQSTSGPLAGCRRAQIPRRRDVGPSAISPFPFAT